ncbi:MAG: AAA family ATPase [Parafilimonas sp.]
MKSIVKVNAPKGFQIKRKDRIIRRRHNIVTGTELLNMKEEEIPHLWDPFIPSTGLSSLVGSSDLGKSSLLRQLATAVALKNKEFLGQKLNVKHGRAIYFSTEDSKIATSIILKRQVGKDVKADDLENLVYILNNDNAYNAINTELEMAKYDLVVIDAFSDVFDGQINDIGSVRRFLNKFDKLANKHECSIIFLHHNGKRTEALNPHKNNIIGSQGFEAKMRTVMELRPNDQLHKRELGFLKGNYILDDRKRETLLLEFNENQQFSYIETKGVTSIKRGREFSLEEKQAILEKAKEYREAGLSLDKTKDALNTDFEKVPSKGTLSNWLKEGQEDVQSVE